MPTILEMARPKTPLRKTEQISVRLDADLLKRLEAIRVAQVAPTTLTYLINTAVAEYVAMHEKPRRDKR